MPETKYKFKLDIGCTDKQFAAMPFGRQIDYWKKIRDFKENAKSVHVSTKRQSFTKAIKEFKDLYKPKFFFVAYREATEFYSDDSVEIWYVN